MQTVKGYIRRHDGELSRNGDKPFVEITRSLNLVVGWWVGCSETAPEGIFDDHV